MGEFITPPSLPPTTYCRRLLIPNTPEWIGTVTGALMDLIYASNWKQTTGITEEEAANRALEMFNLYVNSGNDGECGDMACCDDQVILHRFDPITGRPQISKDGGETWTTDPADIQNQIPLYPPIVHDGSSSTKCDAATNASEHINELIAATGEQLSTAGDIFTLAVGIAEAVLGLFLILVSAGTLTAPVLAVATAIWAAGGAVFALGHDLYEAYWTSDKQDAILCALYCNIGTDGQFTDAQYTAFFNKVKSTLPASPALQIITASLNAGGARGLSQMASYGNAANADCSSCVCGECPTVYDWERDNLVLEPTGECVFAGSSIDQGGGVQGQYLGAIANPPTFPTTTGFKVLDVTASAFLITIGYYNLDGTVVSGHFPDPSAYVAAIFMETNTPFTWTATLGL